MTVQQFRVASSDPDTEAMFGYQCQQCSRVLFLTDRTLGQPVFIKCRRCKHETTCDGKTSPRLMYKMSPTEDRASIEKNGSDGSTRPFSN